jgi:hypothetical protein
MGIKQKEQGVEEEWQAAQAALRAARSLPGGTERFSALRKAGQLRYDADQRRRVIESEMGVGREPPHSK